MRTDKITAFDSKATLNSGFDKKTTTALALIEPIKTEMSQHIDTGSHHPVQ